MNGALLRSHGRAAARWGWRVVLLSLVALAGEVGIVAAQEAAGTAVTMQASDPLPTPSFQRAYLHVFLAFGIAWALMLVYVVLLNRRLREAERDLKRLDER